MRSLERKLPRSLFFMVRRNRGEFSWQFPQGKLNDNETLRQVSASQINAADFIQLQADSFCFMRSILVVC